MFGNATMLKTVKLAGTLQCISEGERVVIARITNLPREGRDRNGKKRFWAINQQGVEILVYADEFAYLVP